MRLYLTSHGPIVELDDQYYALPESWDALLNSENIEQVLREAAQKSLPLPSSPTDLRAPIGTQEVWAAGVTYFRSRVARMEESKSAGGGDFYDRVYAADRPELFFKSPAHRAIGPDAAVRIRRDSRWNVPEPELVLVVNCRAQIVGYTIGNDMSSRDIEGENPLYLPQAKVYDGSCALGPAVLIASSPLPKDTQIEIEIRRNATPVFTGKTDLGQLKRDPAELVEYLYRETTFPTGCHLFTGTGIVPPDSFTLHPGDDIRITINPIGTLRNTVAAANRPKASQ